MSDKIEHALARIAAALEKIEQNTRPPVTDFVDAKITETLWGPTH